ncbi:hypothetical protein [Desulfobulbus sp.]|uniref:hypothetical protein n=1 Tax=Desulfobulbus sp. TaxID=895 RepID=UPI00286F8B87|nr:hypothetical protein [Desulfobulbus sp.]
MDHNDNSTGIGGWLRSVWRTFQPREQEQDPIFPMTDQVVQIADPVIRQAKRYRESLHDPVAKAMAYFRVLIDEVPGPVLLAPNRYYDDPLVKALFASPDELAEVLRLSPEINKLRQNGTQGEMVALLTMRQNERTLFGHKQEGELLLRDVRQQAISFSDHRIVAPTGDLASTKEGIVSRGIEVLAMVAMERITALRARKSELQAKKEYLQGMVKILGGRTHRQELFTGPTGQNREELHKVEEMLTETNRQLEDAGSQIGLPEQSLDHLAAVLREPEKLLSVHQQTLRLNWMGVRVGNEPGNDGHDITLAEFALEEARRWAALVRFTVASPPEP